MTQTQTTDRELRELEQRAAELYGAGSCQLHGVLHVVSSVRAADGGLHVLKIGASAPKSATDFFVLNFWRAHADAIVSSAQLVRSEPALSHALQGPEAAQLARYRSEVLHKSEPPWCAFLTRGGALPLVHPVWSDALRKFVLTTPARAPTLSAELGARAEVVGIDALDVRVAVAWLMARGALTVLIEAGPSTANRLYEPPARVDHLLLSRCEAPVVAEAVGGSLAPDAQLFAGLTRVSESMRDEPSGRWRFERWSRSG
jgi:riboflavin biosynthesis pyrimidine reductase